MVDNISNPNVPKGTFNVDGADLWPAIFPPSTPVAAPTAQTAAPQYVIHSYDAGVIAEGIRAAHRHAVESHVNHGKLVLTGTDPYSVLLAERRKAKRALPKMAAALRGVSSGAAHKVLRQAYESETGSVGLGYELMRHALYFDHDKHRANLRAQGRLRADDSSDGGATPALASDFNTILAHLGGQPMLLRKLGLVIDLVLSPPSATLNGLPGVGQPPPVNPWKVFLSTNPPSFYKNTAYATNNPDVAPNLPCRPPRTSSRRRWPTSRPACSRRPSSALRPRPRGERSTTAFSSLGDVAQYAIYTEDTEGDADQARHREPALPGRDGPRRALPGAPHRRGGDLPDRPRRFARRLRSCARPSSRVNTSRPDAGNQTPSMRRTRVRGYAVDIQVTTPAGVTTPFQSVCLRDTRMAFPVASRRRAEHVRRQRRGIHEGLRRERAGRRERARSALGSLRVGGLEPRLAASRARDHGRDSAGRHRSDRDPRFSPSTCRKGNNLPNSQFTVRARPGSPLPRLRFGNKYTFRARVLDLAGNDMSAQYRVAGMPAPVLNAGNPIPSGSATYLRYEPVPNPVLNLWQAPFNPKASTSKTSSSAAILGVRVLPRCRRVLDRRECVRDDQADESLLGFGSVPALDRAAEGGVGASRSDGRIRHELLQSDLQLAVEGDIKAGTLVGGQPSTPTQHVHDEEGGALPVLAEGVGPLHRHDGVGHVQAGGHSFGAEPGPDRHSAVVAEPPRADESRPADGARAVRHPAEPHRHAERERTDHPVSPGLQREGGSRSKDIGSFHGRDPHVRAAALGLSWPEIDMPEILLEQAPWSGVHAPERDVRSPRASATWS